jgi:hypothetical protein
MSTNIVRLLTDQEQLNLKSELSSLDHLWVKHSRYPTALNQGRSIHLNHVTNELVLYNSILDLVPNTYNIMKSVANDKVISRCYWHKLLSNDQIDKHDDNDLEFIINDQLYARYQIYLDCPDDMTNQMLLIDNKRCNPIIYQNSIVDFDLRLLHHYHNLSDKPWYFLVFDVLKSNIELNTLYYK